MKIKIRDLKEKCWIGGMDFLNYLIQNAKNNSPELALDFEGNKEYKVLLETAILDSFGKDVFEGDILECPERTVSKFVTVEHDGFKFIVNDCGFHRDLDEFTQTNEIKVVGNIYENPELLK